jgi:leucine dehydrogenase
MKPQDNPNFDAHEDVVFVEDKALGFAAIIGIHSTVLGPAAGGCRMTKYASDEDALTDVLRLARGMTYKNAMADLPLGGGKAVIYRAEGDRTRVFEKLGEEVERLGGRYITAEDVGVGVTDMRNVAKRTAYVAGLPKEGGQAGGDPSPWTALGIFGSIKALLNGEVRGRRIAVQGVGAVGRNLCALLAREGASLIVADVNPENQARIVKDFAAETASVEAIHAVSADLFAPCALGAGLNEATIDELGAPIVCGGANNQLATEADGHRLVARGVTYAPDYVVNAGGIINVSAEYLGETADLVEARVNAIADRLMMVLEEAKRDGVPPGEAADRIVRRKLAAAQQH